MGEGKSSRRIVAFHSRQYLTCELQPDYELVDRMRVFPFEPRTAVVLALAGLIPMAPLLALVMPMEEIFKLFLKAMA